MEGKTRRIIPYRKIKYKRELVIGGLEDWRIGGLEGWRIGELEGWGHFFVPTLSGVTPFASNPALAMAISMFFFASCIES